MRPLHAQDARDGTYSVLVSEIDVGGIHDQSRRQVAHDERVRGVADAHQGSEAAG